MKLYKSYTFLYQANEFTKNVYNNIMNLIKVKYKNEYYIYEF